MVLYCSTLDFLVKSEVGGSLVLAFTMIVLNIGLERKLYITLSLSTQVYEWVRVFGNC